MKKILEKAVSMIVAVCLVVAIANIPAYAKVNTISATKTTDAVLSKTYVTPSQAAKKAIATTKPAAAKKATAKKATKKTTAKKAVSLTNKIIKKYTKKGLTALKALAGSTGLSLKTVYNAFVKMGVTKKQMKKVASNLYRHAKKGENFINCASLAVGAYLNISRNLAAIYNLAGDITCSAFSSKTKVFGGTGYGSTLSIQKNGHKNADDHIVTLKDLVTSLKKGQKAMLTVECYNKKGKFVDHHAITVKREKNGKYSVYDILINGGKKITYTAKEFKKLLNGKSAKGKTSSGRTITKSKYLASAEGYLSYKTDKNGIIITTDSKSLIKASFKTTPAYKYMKDSISIADKLLKKKGISSLAKTWLQKAKTLINDCINSSKSFDDKLLFGLSMFYSMQQIEKEKASILALVKYSSFSNKTSIYNVLYPLRKVLKKDITYKIYTKYEEDGINLISAISDKYKLKKDDVYNIFVKNGVTKAQIEQDSYLLVYEIKNNDDIFSQGWMSGNIQKALADIKQLL